MPFPSDTIDNLLKAGYPILWLVSKEEERVAGLLEGIFGAEGEFYRWSCTRGLTGRGGEVRDSREAALALDVILSSDKRGFYIFQDLSHFLGDPRVIRKLKDIYSAKSAANKTIFILSARLSVPDELEKEVVVVDIGLPDEAETAEIFDGAARFLSESLRAGITPEMRDKSIRALIGLGASEMELAVRRAFLGRTAIDSGVIDALLEEKAQIIRKSGMLEFVRERVHLEGIGGLENIKEWLAVRALAFSPRAREFGLDRPKGILLMGISGCGKSLCAKAVATAWGLPLLRLDLNQVYSGTSGSPEEAFSKAIKTVEAVSPCVLWIDEIEAGIARSGEKTADTPASRVFGYFLTWMQEKDKLVFITATANQIDLLPPEVLRKGRFDEIFFVSLPSRRERKEVLRIHLASRGKNPDLFDLDSLAKNTEGMSGAEIEQAVVSALFECFAKGKDLDDRELIIAASSTVPLSTTMREEIGRLERWAANRAVKASKPN
ncbi:MAG: AAA family ATPase [Deltaproteobacteria bacterium]